MFFFHVCYQFSFHISRDTNENEHLRDDDGKTRVGNGIEWNFTNRKLAQKASPRPPFRYVEARANSSVTWNSGPFRYAMDASDAEPSHS